MIPLHQVSPTLLYCIFQTDLIVCCLQRYMWSRAAVPFKDRWRRRDNGRRNEMLKKGGGGGKQCGPLLCLVYCQGPNSFLSLCYALWSPLKPALFSFSPSFTHSQTHARAPPIMSIMALMIPFFLSQSGCIYFLKWSSIDSLSWRGLTSQPV